MHLTLSEAIGVNMFRCQIFRNAFFLLPVLCTHLALAQYEEASFTRYTIKDGLSSNYITSLQQDEMGYLWVATNVGLNRFDGYRFLNFYQGTAPLALGSNMISKLKMFSPNHLGILGRGGLQLLNTKDFSLQNYFIRDSTPFVTYLNSVWEAVPLPGQSFGLTTSSGFYTLDKRGELLLRHDAYKLEDIGKKRIFYGRDIIDLGAQQYLVYTEQNDAARYDAVKKTFTPFLPEDAQWKNFYTPLLSGSYQRIDYQPAVNHELIAFNYAKDTMAYYHPFTQKKFIVPYSLQNELNWESKITAVNDTTFLVNSGNAGFYIFYINRQLGKIWCNPKKFLPEYKIQSLFFDKDKRLWVGTSQGLLKQKLNDSFFKTYYYPSKSFDNSIQGFVSGYRYKNKLYLARFSRYTGLAIIDTATMKMEKEICFYGHNNMWNEIVSIQMYHPDTLWLGTNAGILWFDTKSYRYGKVFNQTNISPDSGSLAYLAPPRKDGYAWFCYILDGVVCQYHIASHSFRFFTAQTKPALPFDKVKSIAYDAYGDVWIGGHSLARWNSQQQTFDTLITVYGGINKFNDDILTLSADEHGSLWLHNADNGLLEYKIKEKKFVSYGIKDGLPSTTFRCFSSVVNNTLWIGGQNYLTRFDVVSKNILTYTDADGFPDESPQGRRIYFDSGRHRFYIFCKNYVAEFPLQAAQSIKNKNELLLQELIVNGSKSFYHPADTLHLAYKEKNLSLQFNIIDFESPGSYHFQYRLNKAPQWTNLGTQRGIQLNEQPPGSYMLEIKAINKTGEEKIKAVYFFIDFPFWKAWWFILAGLLLLAAIIFVLVRWRIKVVHRIAGEKLRLQQLQTEQLQHRLEMEQITNYFTSSVADKNKVDDILWDVARNLIGKLGFEDCIMYLWNADKTRMVQRAGLGAKGSFENIREKSIDVLPGEGIVGDVIQTKEAIIVADTSTAKLYNTDDNRGLSEICVPIICDDELIGIIDSEHHQKNFYTPRHLQIMTTIAALMANKIKSIETEAGLQQKRIEVATLNQQLAEFEMKALYAQMNPHFIFNCLNSIRDMILNAENNDASHYLAKFAHLIRITLEQSKQSFISLRNSMDYLHRYIQMEQIRNADFTCHMAASPQLNLDETLLPPMLIQPFIENAIWHGITTARKKIHITVSFEKRDAYLLCTIDDDGIGIDQSYKNKDGHALHTSVGINNIENRIRLLNEKYKLKSTIRIIDKASLPYSLETGTSVTIQLPIEILEE